MAGDNTKKWQPYQYEPSTAAAAVFAVLFGLMTLLHFFNLFRTRTWPLIPFAVGGIMETVGYIGRIINSHQPYNQWAQGPYIMQNVLLIVSPALFAASIYMLLGRIILLTDGQAHAIISQKWITVVFVGGDVVSFFTQAVGGGFMAADNGAHIRAGEDIITGGICLQVIFFGFFVLTSGVFNVRMRRVPTTRVTQRKLPWQKHLNVLYAMSLLILVRSVFRVIEFVQGNRGFLMSHEWCLYVFDSVLMFAVMVLWAIWHPSEVYALLKGGGRKAVTKVLSVSQLEMIPQNSPAEALLSRA